MYIKTCTTLAFLFLIVSCKAIPTEESEFLNQSTSTNGLVNEYKVERGSPCGGFPQLYIETAEGYCAGLLYAQTSSFIPRDILPVPGRPGHYLISNLANRGIEKGGHIEYLSVNPSTKQSTLTRVIANLTIPHALKNGPQNTVFISLDDRVVYATWDEIFKKVANPSHQVTLHTAVEGLPALFVKGTLNSLHPFAYFAFDEDYNLFVNVGSFLDACGGSVQSKGKECLTVSYEKGNNRDDLALHGSVVHMYKRKGNSLEWDPDFKIVGKGLRNSMGMTFAKNGDLIQVENGRDFSEAARPYEELNIIPKKVIENAKSLPAGAQLSNKDFGHYGWPYCYDHDAQSPEWESRPGYRPEFTFSCRSGEPKFRYVPPYIVLPPHGAPLDVDYYTGNYSDLVGHLLIPLHGYRFPAHRVIAFPTHDGGELSGLPIRTSSATYTADDPTQRSRYVTAEYTPFSPGKHSRPRVSQHKDLITGWFKSKGYRPQGAPSAVATDYDGAVLIPSDKNGVIIRLAKLLPGESKLPAAPQQNWVAAYTQFLADQGPTSNHFQDFLNIRSNVLKKDYCAGCHDDYVHPGDQVKASVDSRLLEFRYILSIGDWIEPGEPNKSALYTKLFSSRKSTMPPPDKRKDGAWEANFDSNAAVMKAWIERLPKFEKMREIKLRGTSSYNVYADPSKTNPCSVSLDENRYLATEGNPSGDLVKITVGDNSEAAKKCGLKGFGYVEISATRKML